MTSSWACSTLPGGLLTMMTMMTTMETIITTTVVAATTTTITTTITITTITITITAPAQALRHLVNLLRAQLRKPGLRLVQERAVRRSRASRTVLRLRCLRRALLQLHVLHQSRIQRSRPQALNLRPSRDGGRLRLGRF